MLPFGKLPDLWNPHVLVEMLQHVHNTLQEICHFPILPPPSHGPTAGGKRGEERSARQVLEQN